MAPLDEEIDELELELAALRNSQCSRLIEVSSETLEVLLEAYEAQLEREANDGNETT